MARVEGKQGLPVRFANWYTRRKYGKEMEITSVIARSRPDMVGWGMFEWWHERGHKVDEKLKDLAATKVATTVGCQFCIDIGSALGRKAGVTEQQLRDFHIYRESPAFSGVEKLVMEYAEAMSQSNVEVPEDLFARLREHFEEEQIVELTSAIAIENYRARFNNALDIAPSDFSEGAYCPMPERQAAAGKETASASAS